MVTKEKTRVISSPIFYMGNKKKLIQKGLIDMFPKNINTFYDLFAGSCVVTMNTPAIYHEVNDINTHLMDLVQWFCYYKAEEIIERIDNLIKLYELPTFSTDNRKYKGDREGFKKNYTRLRSDYNKSKESDLLYVLNIFCLSHMMRFNDKGEFNMPFGNSYFSEVVKGSIRNNKLEDITYISSKDFREYRHQQFEDGDFVYLDPPYIGTDATYNENGGWTETDQSDLHEFCDYLTSIGVKWGMSNVYENKGVENSMLKEWVERKGYNVHYFDDFTYYSNGKGGAKTKEVFIMNY
jgi:DNA adenine methylase Dam